MGLNEQVAEIFASEYGRSVATLIRVLGDIDLAEDAVAEAFGVATERWRLDGVPPNPGGWIVTTARRRALDRLRREAKRDDKQAEAVRLLDTGDSEHDTEHASEHDTEHDEAEGAAVRDDRLRLLFTCCHPALAVPARVALTLRLLGGLTTVEIARAFLVPEATMAARITRAKAKIAKARIPYRVPHEVDLPDRLGGVLAVIYLVFTEGHTASSGDHLVRRDLCAEAIRLGRVLVDLMPDEPEAVGLLALMLLSDARRDAREGGGELVPLAEQDRSRWDAAMIAEGHDLVRRCLRRGRPGPYQIQAAINAVHTDGARPDWAQVLALYDQLCTIAPGPVVSLNRAVAVAEVHGPAAALEVVDAIDLPRYHLFHAVRADLLTRLGRTDEARAALVAAREATENEVERRLLDRRLASRPGE